MAYIDELLSRGERVRFIGHQHLFVLISNILTEMFLIAVLVAAGIVSRSAFQDRVLAGQPVGVLIMLVCTVISLIVLISAVLDYFRWNNEQYVVTDQRVIQIRGIFNKSVTDSSLEKINDVMLSQTWIGRIFDFGDIEIVTGSDVGVNMMRRIGQPLEFKKAMMEAKQDYTHGFGYMDPGSVAAYVGDGDDGRGRQHQAQHGSRSLEETLRNLSDLRDMGLLSPEEFEAKKRELLRRV